MQAEFNGYVYAVAEKHPLQTRLTFVLTDFSPNKNNQAIPRDEAENVIASAVGMPVKINFNGISEGGHSRATPVGPITDARIQTIEDRDVILAEAILWKSEFEDIDEYLRSSTAENKRIGTSWELYYKESEVIENIEWLKGVIVAGTAIVKDPAYGDRTPILSIAELNLEEKVKLVEIQNEELRLMIEGLRLDIEAMRTEHEALKAEHDKVVAERDALIQEKRDEEERQEAARRYENRKEALSEVGYTVDTEDAEIRQFLSTVDDSVFALFLRVNKAVKPAAVAETQIRVPGTIGSSTPKHDAVADALSKYFSKN